MKRNRGSIIGGVITLLVMMGVFAWLFNQFRFYSNFDGFTHFGGFFIVPIVAFVIISTVMALFIRQIIKSVRDNRTSDHHNKNNEYYTDSYNHNHDRYDQNQPRQYNVYREYRCPMCKSTYEPEQKFCTNCGNKLRD